MRNFSGNNEAVSPVVASLLLIIVVAGGAAFLSTLTRDVSSQTGSVVGKSNGIEITSIKLNIMGSELAKPAIDALAATYNNKQLGVMTQSQGSGTLGITSGSGIASTGEGVIDIGTADRKATPAELEKYPDLNLYKLGTSGIVIIVNNGTSGPPVGIFDKNTLLGLYNGTNTTLRAYRMSGSPGTEKAFLQYIGNSSISKNIPEVTGSAGMLEAVKNNAPSTGFIEYGYVDTGEKRGQNVHIAGLLNESSGITYTGMNASNFTAAASGSNVNNSAYPLELAHPLYFVSKGKPSYLADAFIKWAVSYEGQDIVEKAGYISYMREIGQ